MTTTAPAGNRFERRRAETRKALVRAARQILAESSSADPSIQAIAERADVGFGSFYNHFASKEALFDAAVADALEEYGEAIDEQLHGVEDPAERVAVGVRLSARMAHSHPEIMQILRHRGLGHIYSDRGLSRRALEDIEAGLDRGRFEGIEPPIALCAMGGSLLALIELMFTKPELGGHEAAENLAEMLLRMLGLTAAEAREIARRPLPTTG